MSSSDEAGAVAGMAAAGTPVIGLDIGGTKIAGGLVDPAASGGGAVLRRAQRPTPAQEGPEAILDAAAEVIRELVEACEEAAPGRELHPAVGVGSAGVIDPATGTVMDATPNLRGWAGTPLRDGLLSRCSGLGIRGVGAVNDVHAHALGELAALQDSSRPPEEGDLVLVVAFGTGVGGALLTAGTGLRFGPHRAAGHIGLTPVPHHERLDLFRGNVPKGSAPERMIMEQACSGPAIHRAYLALGGSAADTREVLARVGEDPRAREAVDCSAEVAGLALAGLVDVLDPDRVLVCGGLAGAGPEWWRPLEESYRSMRLPVITTQLEPTARTDGDAALVGAARAGLEAEIPAPGAEAGEG